VRRAVKALAPFEARTWCRSAAGHGRCVPLPRRASLPRPGITGATRSLWKEGTIEEFYQSNKVSRSSRQAGFAREAAADEPAVAGGAHVAAVVHHHAAPQDRVATQPLTSRPS